MKKRPLFLQIQGSGRKIALQQLLAFYQRSDLPHPRLGITVSKTVGNAVVRNRVKRLIRECFRQQKGTLPNVDLVIIARSSAKDATFAQVCGQMRTLAQRLAQGR